MEGNFAPTARWSGPNGDQLQSSFPTMDDPAVTLDVVRDEAAVAVTQVERLTGVVDTMRHRSKGEKTQLPEISLDSVLAGLQREYQPAFTAARRSMRVVGPPGLAVRAAPVDLAQILQILIENSLDHGAGRVEIETRSSGSSVVVEVRDEGEGVPAPGDAKIAAERGIPVLAASRQRQGDLTLAAGISTHALLLDGGSSTGVAWNGQAILDSTRKISYGIGVFTGYQGRRYVR